MKTAKLASRFSTRRHDEPLLLPVQGRDEAHVEAAEPLLGEAVELEPAVGGRLYHEERALAGGRDAEPLLDEGARLLLRQDASRSSLRAPDVGPSCGNGRSAPGA